MKDVEVDLSDYYTKSQIDGKGYLTSVPSEYVTETELNSKNYATKKDLEDIEIDVDINLDDYYTKQQIDSKGYLTSVPSEYVTETELNSKNYATKEDLKDIEVDVDMSNYYTKEEINRMIGNVNSILDAVLNYSDLSDVESRLNDLLYTN